MQPVAFRQLTLALVAAGIMATAAPSGAALVVTKASELGTLSAPVTLSIGNAFNDASPGTVGIQLGAAGTVLPTDTFLDGYGFEVSGAGFSAITATLNLGSFFQISDLQLNLYSGTLGAAVLGSLPSDATSPWTIGGLLATGSANGNAQEIGFVDLPAGNYVLEVRGSIIGTSGGSYAGTISLSPLSPPELLPVPEPTTVALVGAGLLALIGFARRSQALG